MQIPSFRIPAAFANLVAALSVSLAMAGAVPSVSAGTSVGDEGHFISYSPKLHMLNPDGREFTVSIHSMRWGHGDWNKPHVEATITNPEGVVLTEGEHELDGKTWSFTVPEGPAGVYLVEPVGNCWVTSSLDRAVAWTGDPEGHAVEGRRLVVGATVPRRWWFWVPPDVEEFTVRAQRADRYMSQREDWAFFIYTPRGQRIRALVGQPDTALRPYRQDMVATVPVEPGTGGRFWSVRIAYGDSHNYSNVNIALDGIPPYVARSPEEWFNPDTGEPPEIPLYDETPFIQAAPLQPMMKERWPGLQHFMPAPSLGDPDGNTMRDGGRFALWNPEDRPLGFRIGTYLPRKEDGELPQAKVKIAGGAADSVLDRTFELEHIHGSGKQPKVELRTGAGVAVGEVLDARRWFAFTYPATPAVLMGEENDGWRHFRFAVCAPRNWYFYVPKGTESFQVGFDADHADDVVKMGICAPDRVVELLHANSVESATVKVPEGLDGKMWYLRSEIAEATQLRNPSPPYRYQEMPITLRIRGVKGYLAPTWEQWFDPDNPRPPLQRGDGD